MYCIDNENYILVLLERFRDDYVSKQALFRGYSRIYTMKYNLFNAKQARLGACFAFILKLLLFKKFGRKHRE